MSTFRFHVCKSPIPIIWLDTSVIFNMTLWKTGRSHSGPQQERVKYLYERIYELTRQRKLICPRADQEEEIWYERVACLDIINTLSLGIRARYSEQIKEDQIWLLMNAFVKGTDQVPLDYRGFFEGNPVQELNNTARFFITADMGLLEPKEVIKRGKVLQIEKLEKLRRKLVAKGVSYEEQLGKEFLGELDAIDILFSSCIRKLDQAETPTLNELAGAQTRKRYLAWWKQLCGKPSGVEGLRSFLASEYYKSVPSINISSRIMASLITSTDPMKPGHSMDINHAASAIPYVDVFLTDRFMKHTLKKLGIDRQYNTKVCYAGDRDEFEAFFDRL